MPNKTTITTPDNIATACKNAGVPIMPICQHVANHATVEQVRQAVKWYKTERLGDIVIIRSLVSKGRRAGRVTLQALIIGLAFIIIGWILGNVLFGMF